MKAHVGVDMATGLVHTDVGTAGNVADVTQTHALLHGGEKVVLGDAGYQGVARRPENAGKAIDWHTAMRTQGAQEESAGPSQGKAGASEGQRAREGRALLPLHEVPVQTSQDALPRTCQEKRAAVHAGRFR